MNYSCSYGLPTSPLDGCCLESPALVWWPKWPTTYSKWPTTHSKCPTTHSGLLHKASAHSSDFWGDRTAFMGDKYVPAVMQCVAVECKLFPTILTLTLPPPSPPLLPSLQTRPTHPPFPLHPPSPFFLLTSLPAVLFQYLWLSSFFNQGIHSYSLYYFEKMADGKTLKTTTTLHYVYRHRAIVKPLHPGSYIS